MEILVLCRHGESVYSAEKRANGDPRVLVPLTENGRAQAWEARSLLDDVIDLCVVTPFIRTIETADIALAGRRVPRVVAQGLGDVRYGDFEGKPLEQCERWVKEHGAQERIPGGGESREDVARRTGRSVRALLNRPERVILAVCHDLPISDVLNAAAGKPLPLTSDHLEYATPYRLSRVEIERAAETLEMWRA